MQTIDLIYGKYRKLTDDAGKTQIVVDVNGSAAGLGELLGHLGLPVAIVLNRTHDAQLPGFADADTRRDGRKEPEQDHEPKAKRGRKRKSDEPQTDEERVLREAADGIELLDAHHLLDRLEVAATDPLTGRPYTAQRRVRELQNRIGELEVRLVRCPVEAGDEDMSHVRGDSMARAGLLDLVYQRAVILIEAQLRGDLQVADAADFGTVVCFRNLLHVIQQVQDFDREAEPEVLPEEPEQAGGVGS